MSDFSTRGSAGGVDLRHWASGDSRLNTGEILAMIHEVNEIQDAYITVVIEVAGAVVEVVAGVVLDVLDELEEDVALVAAVLDAAEVDVELEDAAELEAAVVEVDVAEVLLAADVEAVVLIVDERVVVSDEVVVTDAGVVYVIDVDFAFVVVVQLLGQWKLMLWMPTLHVGLLFGGFGRTTVTFFAPPHWVFLTDVPSLEQDVLCLHVEPSSIP